MGTQLLHNYTVKQLVKIFDIDQPGNTTNLEIYENPKKIHHGNMQLPTTKIITYG